MNRWYRDHKDEIKSLAIRNAVTTVSHPFEFAKVLMQLGYEPFPPVESKTLIFRARYLALPNVLSYLRYLKSVDGFFGCYRGLVPRLFEANVYFYTYNKCSEKFPVPDRVGTENDNTGKLDKMSTHEIRAKPAPKFMSGIISSDIQEFLHSLGRDCVAVTVGTTVSYPFHVIAVRAMAQFVGRECKYESLLGSISEIYKCEGILGFFKGLCPRIISEVLNVVIAGTCIFLVMKYLTKENIQITTLGAGFVANTFSYQFHLVSNNMIANTCSLAIGKPPQAYKYYVSWYDCWVTLRQNGQLTRGSSMIGRQYTGPTRRVGSEIHPVDFVFGPLHSAGLGFEKTCTSKPSKSL